MKISIWLILSLSLTCNAQVQSWKSYYDSTNLYWAKDWPKAVSLLEEAERSALNDLGSYDENYLTILNDLGTAYWKAKRYPQAEVALSRSLSLKSERYSDADKDLMYFISNLAGFYAERGEFARSKSLYCTIVRSGPVSLPPHLWAEAALNLARLYDKGHEPDSAWTLLSLIDNWHVLPPNSILSYQHQYQKARTLRQLRKYDEAQDGLSKLMLVLKASHADEMTLLYARCHLEQGILHFDTRNFKEAEQSLRHARNLAVNAGDDEILEEISVTLGQMYENAEMKNCCDR